MSFYTTPLQFGYFFSLLMALLFWIRGVKEERLSDKLLGWLMLILALELQDYTFGFAGINYLWDELNGFPRSVALLFGPSLYFYIRSQVNRNFHFRKLDAIHLLPWSIYFFIEIVVFLQGEEAINTYQRSELNYWLSILNYIARLLSYSYYFYLSLKIYKAYRQWSIHQYSNPDAISFQWFRNFIYLMALWIVFREIMNVIDYELDLDFYEDWWWNLALAVTAFYVGLKGYSQQQPAFIQFESGENIVAESMPKNKELEALAEKVSKIMKEDRLFLQPDLSLQELAKHLKTNSRELSNCINQLFELNFNDYINSYRIQAFEKQIEKGADQQYTLLSIALDCGFNSKATFNRAFKKEKGISPKAYIAQNK